MKKLFLLFTLAFVAMSCEEIQDFIDPKGHGLVFLEGEMKAYFDDKGDTKNYKFKADLAWSAEVSADWVEVNPTSGPAGENKIKIKVDKNKSDEKRTGYVDITLSNNKSYRIELVQLAVGENLDDVISAIPNNEIWYTTTDGEVLSLNQKAKFNVNIVSNRYTNGKGVIKFSGDVIEIGADSFANCTTLSSLSIPATVEVIGYSAFLNCESLNAIYISDLAAWCNIDFINSPTTGNVGWGTNPLCYGGELYLKNRLVTDLIVPDGVTVVKTMAFAGCGSITSVTIPDSVTTIENHAFNYCVGLSSVKLGDNVATIGSKAFDACINLTEITIPDSVVWIGSQAFCYCMSLQSFNGKFASEDGMCLIVDGHLIGFAVGCDNVGDYVIPDDVTVIDMYSIYYCQSITSVVIPDSVTMIAEGAFKDCRHLTSVYCMAIDPPACMYYDYWNTFDYNAYGRKIYVPMESVEHYKYAICWDRYASAIVGYEF